MTIIPHVRGTACCPHLGSPAGQDATLHTRQDLLGGEEVLGRLVGSGPRGGREPKTGGGRQLTPWRQADVVRLPIALQAEISYCLAQVALALDVNTTWFGRPEQLSTKPGCERPLQINSLFGSARMTLLRRPPSTAPSVDSSRRGAVHLGDRSHLDRAAPQGRRIGTSTFGRGNCCDSR